MSLISIEFLLFLFFFVVAYFALPDRIPQKWLLLAASYFFYSFGSLEMAGLLGAVTLLTYVFVHLLAVFKQTLRAKLLLAIAISLNIALLCCFKYLDFIRSSIFALTGFMPWPVLNLTIPMGISFYVFKSISLLVDTYRDVKNSDCPKLVDLALFLAFFPTIAAGPIMRYKELGPQFAGKKQLQYTDVLSGALLVMWGLSKKIFLGDSLGRFVDEVYGSAEIYAGHALGIATYGYALQIYFDFSGYTDIARGTGRILGIQVANNFRLPYLSSSVREFWRRWHISLSTWLRDYLYIPLGGNKRGTLRTYENLIFTMLLGGIWHGPAWTFVIWGLLHGGFLAGEHLLDKFFDIRSKSSGLYLVAHFLVTFHLICLAWIFFRSPDVSTAIFIVKSIFSFRIGEAVSWWPLMLLAATLVVQMLWKLLGEVSMDRLFARRCPHFSRWLAYLWLLLLGIAMSGGMSPEFIYFRF